MTNSFATPVGTSYSGLCLAVTRLMEEEAGQDLIEYALLAALIALGTVVAVKGLSTKTSAAFKSINKSFKKVSS